MGTLRSDHDLLRGYVEHSDHAAFQSIVERHGGMVYAVALRKVADPEAARDIAQTVFATLARKATTLNPDYPLPGWLFRATVFEASKTLRGLSIQHRKLQQLAENQSPAPAPTAGSEETLHALDHAIAALPDSDRALVTQHYLQRKPYRTIAAELGITEPACRMRAHRALGRLGTLLRASGVTAPAIAFIAFISRKFTNQSLLPAMATTKTVTIVALLAAVPITLLYRENAQLKQTLTNTQTPPHRLASQPVAPAVVTPAPTPGLSNASALWRRALFQSDPVLRSTQISDLLSTLTAKSAPLVAAVFTEAQEAGNPFDREANLFVRAWGKLDGTAALAHALEKSGTTSANPLTLAAISGWASTDPAAARDWVTSPDAGDETEPLIYGLLDGWSIVDFQAASTFAQSRPRSDQRDRFIDLLLQRSLLDGGLPSAQAWFANIDDGEHNQIYKQKAFDRIIRTMLLRDPSAAAHWIANQQDAAHLTGHAIPETANKLAELDPARALDWLTSLQTADVSLTTEPAADIIASWAAENPNATGNWLGTHIDDPAYDTMAGRFSTAIASIDPAAATSWASTIADPALRNQTQISVAREILTNSQDEIGAVRTLLASGIDPSAIEQARSPTDAFFSDALHYNKQLGGLEAGLEAFNVLALQNTDAALDSRLQDYTLSFRTQTEVGSFFERSFAGGATNLRGFDYREASPSLVPDHSTMSASSCTNCHAR